MRIFIHCADPRQEANLEEKVNHKLLAPGEKIIRISLLGGPICLAHPQRLKPEFVATLNQLNFALKTFRVSEIVLVGHDCGFYSSFGKRPTLQEKKADLVKAAELLSAQGWPAQISAYFDTSSAGHVSFEDVLNATALAE